VGYAQLRGRPLTLASLSRNVEMPLATVARILDELKLSRWVHKRGKHYLLDLGRLEEPGYAEYFEEAERRISIAKKRLSELNISSSVPTALPDIE
jgi:DNA-binding IclR family transcriptional regulator